MSARIGESICTYTGVEFFPLDPRAEEIRIEDIAHALANMCRFTGHTRKFYSVAEHSVRVAWEVARRYQRVELARAALMHDASEAYLVDVPRPLKRDPALARYREVEELVQQAIDAKFGCALDDPAEHAALKAVDDALLITEKRDLLPDLPWIREAFARFSVSPLESTIEPWPPVVAKVTFLGMFRELFEQPMPEAWT